MKIGSGYEDFVRKVLTKELESHLERIISTEEEFVEGCRDYFVSRKPIELVKTPSNLEGHKLACYLCLRTVTSPQFIEVDGVQVSLHPECIIKEVAKYIP